MLGGTDRHGCQQQPAILMDAEVTVVILARLAAAVIIAAPCCPLAWRYVMRAASICSVRAILAGCGAPHTMARGRGRTVSAWAGAAGSCVGRCGGTAIGSCIRQRGRGVIRGSFRVSRSLRADTTSLGSGGACFVRAMRKKAG